LGVRHHRAIALALEFPGLHVAAVMILIFDGLGLNSEVAYFDPVRAIAADEPDAIEDEQDFSMAVGGL
jgi:hypothetical protein